MNLIVSRKMVVTLGAVLMIGPGMIGLFTNPYVAIMLLCIGGFAHQALSGALITLSSDVFGRNEVATANGLTGMSAWLASTLFAPVSYTHLDVYKRQVISLEAARWALFSCQTNVTIKLRNMTSL